MHALIAAGGIPLPEDPLYPYTKGKPKALVDIGGKPMIQWMLDALGGAACIHELVIVGLNPDTGLVYPRQIHFVDDQGDLLSNVKAGLDRVGELEPVSNHTLYASCDIPSITPAIVEWRVQSALDADTDMDYAAIERSVMEQRFPHSKRTYVRLKHHEVCGSDMNLLRLTMVRNEELWARLVEARKSPLKQAALFGLDTLLLLLSRQLTFERGERIIRNRFGINGRIHLSPYAEIGMDVDKPSQLEALRNDLATQRSSSP